jgi:hypothetical protein
MHLHTMLSPHSLIGNIYIIIMHACSRMCVLVLGIPGRRMLRRVPSTFAAPKIHEVSCYCPHAYTRRVLIRADTQIVNSIIDAGFYYQVSALKVVQVKHHAMVVNKQCAIPESGMITTELEYCCLLVTDTSLRVNSCTTWVRFMCLNSI